MVHRIVWPITALVGLIILAVGISTVPAQPGMGMMYGMPQVGRFVVAHASEKQIIILDTTTGKLYKATDADFKKASEMPKVEMPRMPGGPDRGFTPPKDFRPPKDFKFPKDVKPPKDFEKFREKFKDKAPPKEDE